MKKIVAPLRASFGIVLVFTLLLGVVYPLLVTALSQLAFNDKANGSLISKDGKIVGSALLGQEFTEAKYFWGRPSANKYDAANSGGSNLGPSNPLLLEVAKKRAAVLKDGKNKVPAELVLASASGLDPHISLEAAKYQLSRVARARGMKVEDVQKLVDEHVDMQSEIFGMPFVNVLELNLALDKK